ncbi:MAG: hypothetical protein AB1609_13745 [Bacillota bacterium]
MLEWEPPSVKGLREAAVGVPPLGGHTGAGLSTRTYGGYGRVEMVRGGGYGERTEGNFRHGVEMSALKEHSTGSVGVSDVGVRGERHGSFLSRRSGSLIGCGM